MTTLVNFKTVAVILPVKGNLILKEDYKAITGLTRKIGVKTYSLIVSNTPKSTAEEKIKELKGKLSREYKVFFVSENQIAKSNDIKDITSYATKKQLDNHIIIK